MGAVAGIDVGSTTVKVVILDREEKGAVLFRGVEATGAYARDVAARLVHAGLDEADLGEEDLDRVAATGYGRKLVAFADEQISEITANARGALHLAGGPGRVRTVVDIGGQDSKVIALDSDGRMVNFAMNDKCAAGTGRFLEVLARALEVELGDLGETSLGAAGSVEISATCTVFAESEVVGLLARGERVPDIAAAVHRAVARQTAALALKVGVNEPVLFDGGPALNAGLRAALSEELGAELTVPDDPQAATALGAAIIAAESAGPGGRRRGARSLEGGE